VDNSGNVYVTGWSIGSGTGYDYATIKYDSLGNQLWVERYNGPGSYDDQANAIALDSSGGVYVTGYSYGNGPSQDYAPQDFATIKYDSQGNQLWVERYHGYVYGDNVAHAVAADKSGNVYVTGYSGGLGTSHDYVTVKYDSVGNQLWVETYNGPANGGDAALAIALGNSGNVYVTGTSYGGEPYHDYGYATVKYDSLGNQLWAKRYDPAANGSAVVWSIATDDLGNVFVTGWSPIPMGGTIYDYLTIKYKDVPYMRGDADGDKKIWCLM
jgi:hypothetical protein